MPCITVNSYNFAQQIIPGDTEIGNGTSDFRDAPYSFYYDASYSGIFLTPTQLSGIPNNATITRVEFEYEILTNGVYDKILINRCNI